MPDLRLIVSTRREAETRGQTINPIAGLIRVEYSFEKSPMARGTSVAHAGPERGEKRKGKGEEEANDGEFREQPGLPTGALTDP